MKVNIRNSILKISLLTLVALVLTAFVPMFSSPKNVSASATDVLVQSYYEENNNNNGGVYSFGGNGGTVSVDNASYSAQVIADTTSSSTLYIKTSDSYTLEGVYSEYASGMFGGTSFDFTEQDDHYTVDLSNAVLYTNNLYVKFTLKRVNIIIESNEYFSFTGSGKYIVGSPISINAQPNGASAIFSRWVSVVGDTETTFSTNKTDSFTASQDLRLKVVPKYLLNIVPNDNGQINVLKDGVLTTETYFEPKTDLIVEAVANNGYKFVDFKDAYAGNPSSFRIRVSGPVTIEGIFESKGANITISSTNIDHSSLEGSTNTENIEYYVGDTVRLNVTVGERYKFTGWLTNASGQIDLNSESLTYTVTAQDVERGNIYFTASIIKEYAYASLVVYGGGVVSTNGVSSTTGFTQNKLLNTSYKMEFLPNNMYELSELKYTNLETRETKYLLPLQDGKYEFDVTEDFEISATFTQILWSQHYTMPSGSGTKDDPYMITTPEEFAFIAYAVNNSIWQSDTKKVDYHKAYYMLTKNLDFTGKYWEKVSTRFIGTLDVNFRTIENVTLQDETKTTNYKDLFAGKVNIKREIGTVWTIAGISISAILTITIILILIYMSKSKTKIKKVVILPPDLNEKN